MKKRNIIIVITIVIIAIVIVAIFYARHLFNAFMQTETVKIDDNLTLVLGGGGNSGIIVTDSAVLVIDTKMKDKAKELNELVKSVAANKPVIVVNTHYHSDHSGGNNFYKGSKIYIGSYDTAFLHKNISPENWPNVFVKDSLKLNIGNEIVDLYNMGQAHTLDDVIIYLENRKLLFSGDLIFNHTNPVLRNESGADVDKWIAVLNKILNKVDIISIVPGHGKVGGKEIAENMKNYFEDMKMAANDENKAAELKKKYADWRTMPMFASPDITIEYIKKNK